MSSVCHVCHRGQLQLFSLYGLEEEACSTLAWSMQEKRVESGRRADTEGTLES